MAGVCRGDSGGGAFLDSGEVVAVTSWLDDAPEMPDQQHAEAAIVGANLARIDRGEVLFWLHKILKLKPPAIVAANIEPQNLIQALELFFGTDRSEHPSIFFVIPYLQREPKFACLDEKELNRLARAIRRAEEPSLEEVLATAPACPLPQ